MYWTEPWRKFHIHDEAAAPHDQLSPDTDEVFSAGQIPQGENATPFYQNHIVEGNLQS
jgi:hypothetical protein